MNISQKSATIMNPGSFDIIKQNLSNFNTEILENWKITVFSNPAVSLDSYVGDVPYQKSTFPHHAEALIPQPNDTLTLEKIALEPDAGEGVEFVMTTEMMRRKLSFAATPVERPRLVKKKKKKTKKKKSHEGGTHRSESMMNLRKK